MNWFLGYLAGACLAGFIFEICYVYIDSFYKLLVREIDNAKDELRKTGNLSDEYRVLLESIDNDSIIKSLPFASFATLHIFCSISPSFPLIT